MASTYYLIDLSSDTIAEAVEPPEALPQALITGCYVVRVPSDVDVQEPTNLADLLTKKYQGTLAAHALFASIEYDDMLDASGVDTVNPATINVQLGERGGICLLRNGILQTTVSSIAWSGPAPGPDEALVTWEVFRYDDVDDKTAPYARYYREIDALAAPVGCEISFDGGTTWTGATDKSLTSIPLAKRGTSLVLKFSRTGGLSTHRYFLGSWSVLF
jgi:hypothetical protein